MNKQRPTVRPIARLVILVTSCTSTAILYAYGLSALFGFPFADAFFIGAAVVGAVAGVIISAFV